MKTLLLTLILIPTLTLASINTNLRLGNKGPEVTKLQTYLVQKGYNTQITGYFGIMTLNAVKKFQLNNEIPSTGYVGPLTRKFINSPITVTPPPVVATTTAAGSAPVTPPVQPPTVSTPIATTTATTLPTVPPVYNGSMNENTNTVATLGTPYAEALTGAAYAGMYNGLIPVTVDKNIIRAGGKIVIDGTIPNENGLSGIGREFSSRSGKDFLIHLMQARGVYTYKVTATDAEGNLLSESTGTINVPKFPQEL